MNILKLETTAGFLVNCPLSFAPNGVTFIIGPRGCFKSTSVRLIGSVLSGDEERAAEDFGPEGSLRAALAGGKVRVTLSPASTGTVVGSVVAERDADGPATFSPEVFVSCEFWGQGELQKLAEEKPRRLALLDSTAREARERLFTRRDAIVEELEQLGPKIRHESDRLRDLAARAASIAETKAALAKLRAELPPKPPELAAEQAEHVARSNLLESVRELLAVRDEIVEGYRSSSSRLGEQGDSIVALEKNTAPAAQEVAGVLADLRSVVDRATAWCDRQRPSDQLLAALAAAFSGQSRRYETLARAQKSHEDALRRETDLVKNLAAAERAARELEDVRASVALKKARRNALRAQLRGVDQDLCELREARVEELRPLCSQVVFSLERGTDRSDYLATLESLVGSPETRKLVAARVSPHELVDAAEALAPDRLVAAGVSPARALKLLEELRRSDLYRLEAVRLEDELEISWRDGDVLKPLEHLSEGQRATALLPLVTSGDAAIPLLLDQPEDDLDNRFVAGEVVPHFK